jgi:pimeloyl-ACP methyl ester carboxylesterase
MVAAFAAGAPPGMAQTAVPGLPLERYQAHDARGRAIDFYLGHPAAPAPLLLMIQGSGCDRVLHLDAPRPFSTLYNFIPYAGEGSFAVMAVEKPFSGAGGSDGTTLECGAAFNADFTAESWLDAIEAALDTALRQPWVRKDRVLVVGGSEGAVMAALLARRDPRVTDVAMIGGSGTTQLFDMIALAYQRCFDRSPCIAEIERQARAIAARPDSATDFAWGHPFRRWSSFFRAEPGDALLASRARVHLAFGTADASVPPLSQEILVAKLLGAGRDVTVDRIADADHALQARGAQDLSGLDREYRSIFNWFAAGGK